MSVLVSTRTRTQLRKLSIHSICSLRIIGSRSSPSLCAEGFWRSRSVCWDLIRIDERRVLGLFGCGECEIDFLLRLLFVCANNIGVLTWETQNSLLEIWANTHKMCELAREREVRRHSRWNNYQRISSFIPSDPHKSSLEIIYIHNRVCIGSSFRFHYYMAINHFTFICEVRFVFIGLVDGWMNVYGRITALKHITAGWGEWCLINVFVSRQWQMIEDMLFDYTYIPLRNNDSNWIFQCKFNWSP